MSYYEMHVDAGLTWTWEDLINALRSWRPSETVPLRLSPGVDWSKHTVAGLVLEADGLRVWMVASDDLVIDPPDDLYIEERDETGVWQARGCFMDPDDVEDLMTAEDKALLDRVAREAWLQDLCAGAELDADLGLGGEL